MRISMFAAMLAACSPEVYAPSGAGQGAGATSDAGGGGGTSGGTGAGAGSGVATEYLLEKYVGPKVWTGLSRTAAADGKGRLFVTDGQAVYVVEDGVPSVYMTYTEIDAAIGGGIPNILYVDVGPDGRLYLLNHAAPAKVLVSEAPHEASVLAALPAGPWRLGMAVHEVDRALVVSSKGMVEVGPSSVEQVYGDQTLKGVTSCSEYDFSATHDGFFYYLSQCYSGHLYKGATDGSGVGVALEETEIQDTPDTGLLGIDAHPAGGAVLGVERVHEYNAYHVDSGGPPVALHMTPSLTEVGMKTDVDWLFYDPVIEVAPSGEIYFVTEDTIFRAVPK